MMLKIFIVNLGPLMDLQIAYRHLLLLSEMSILHPILIAKYLTLKHNL